VKGLEKRSINQPVQSTARWLYTKLSDFMKSEIHHRCVQAAELGLAPKVLEYLVPLISQPYCGDVRNDLTAVTLFHYFLDNDRS
jgi:hypothetical protein